MEIIHTNTAHGFSATKSWFLCVESNLQALLKINKVRNEALLFLRAFQSVVLAIQVRGVEVKINAKSFTRNNLLVLLNQAFDLGVREELKELATYLYTGYSTEENHRELVQVFCDLTENTFEKNEIIAFQEFIEQSGIQDHLDACNNLKKVEDEFKGAFWQTVAKKSDVDPSQTFLRRFLQYPVAGKSDVDLSQVLWQRFLQYLENGLTFKDYLFVKNSNERLHAYLPMRYIHE